MKELEDLLRQMRGEGRVDSDGVFTTSPEGALHRLSERLLPDPQMYLLKCVQALVASGAESIVVRQKVAWVEIEAPVTGGPPALDPTDWIPQAWRSEDAALRHLAVALVGGWRLFDEIGVHWGPLRWRFLPGQGTLPQESPGSAPSGHARIEFKRKQWKLLPEAPPHFDRVFACPVPLESPWTWSPWQVKAYTGLNHFPAPGMELIAALAVTGQSCLMVPDLVRGTPVFFTPERPSSPLLRTSQKNDGMQACWHHARRFYLVIDRETPSALLPVEHGVGLDPVRLDLGVAGLYCMVSVEAEGLKTDLGQFRLLQDAAFARLTDELRQEAPRLLNEVARCLEEWQPSSGGGSTYPALGGFLAGGLLGFGLIAATGWFFPFHVLALPGSLLGAYWGNKRWRQRAVRRLRERTERLAPSPEG